MNSEDLLSSLLQFWTLTWMLVLARVSMFFVTFPIFRSSTIPKQVKIALIVALSIVSLMVASTSPEFYRTSMHDHYVAYAIAIGREMFLGGILGYALSLFFLPAQVAGYYIGQEMGLSMASMADPTADKPANVVADLVYTLSMLVFFAGNVHHFAIGLICYSFQKLPVGKSVEMFNPYTFSMGISMAHQMGMQLIAPIAIGLFLALIVISLIMKMSPQLNLFTIGTPIRLIVGFAGMFIFIPDVLVSSYEMIGQMKAFVLRLSF